MAPLELSTVAKVEDYLRLAATRTDAQKAIDRADLTEALAVAREWITGRVRPRDRLPTELPASLHRAATIKAAEIAADATGRYGVSQYRAEGDTEDRVPAGIQVMRLIDEWAAAQVGVGPAPPTTTDTTE